MGCARTQTADKSMLFQRLTLSKNKDEVLKLAQDGQIVEKPEYIIVVPFQNNTALASPRRIIDTVFGSLPCLILN